MFGRGSSGERRSVNRYEAVGTIALGWRDGTEFRSTDATLLDISQQGASFTALDAPRRGAPAWLLVGDGTSEVWLRGTVVDVSRGWRGRYTIRVRFDESCPYEFMRSSIRGMAIGNGEMGVCPENHCDQHLWP